MFCSQCGTHVSGTARYCEECGTPCRHETGARVGRLPPRTQLPSAGVRAVPSVALAQGAAGPSAALVPGVGTAVQPAAAFWRMVIGVVLMGALGLFHPWIAVLIMETALWLLLLDHRSGRSAFRVTAREKGARAAPHPACLGGWSACRWAGLALTGSALASLWIELYTQRYDVSGRSWNNPTQLVLTLLLLGLFSVFDHVRRRCTSTTLAQGTRLPQPE